MRKQIEVTLPDLFHLQPTLRETILTQIKKDRRATCAIISKKCNCSESSAKRNLELLKSEGLVKDLGLFKHPSGRIRVYEIV